MFFDMFSQELKSWSELDTILKDQTNNETGTLIERFCKPLLATPRRFCAKHVYLGSKIPEEERSNNDLSQDELLINLDETLLSFKINTVTRNI